MKPFLKEPVKQKWSSFGFFAAAIALGVVRLFFLTTGNPSQMSTGFRRWFGI